MTPNEMEEFMREDITFLGNTHCRSTVNCKGGVVSKQEYLSDLHDCYYTRFKAKDYALAETLKKEFKAKYGVWEWY